MTPSSSLLNQPRGESATGSLNTVGSIAEEDEDVEDDDEQLDGLFPEIFLKISYSSNFFQINPPLLPLQLPLLPSNNPDLRPPLKLWSQNKSQFLRLPRHSPQIC